VPVAQPSLSEVGAALPLLMSTYLPTVSAAAEGIVSMDGGVDQGVEPVDVTLPLPFSLVQQWFAC